MGLAGPQSPESPSCHNQHAPIPYEQLHPGGGPGVPVGVASPTPWAHGQPGVAGGGTPSSPSADGTKSLPRPTHPLKSFSVPGPPLQSQPGTPTPKPHLGMILLPVPYMWRAACWPACLLGLLYLFPCVCLCVLCFPFFSKCKSSCHPYEMYITF